MRDTNPFQVLYVTDSPDPRAFVELFSDYPIKFSHPIFQPGNVVLKGTQGSGKSMLLNLLRPEIRVAYAHADSVLPLPKELSKFISGGINLTLSGALDIGQRPIGLNPEEDEVVFPLLFGDFLNYFVVRDILRTLDTAVHNKEVFQDMIAFDRLDDFARALAKDDCWFGFLNNVSSFVGLCAAIDQRLVSYRSFHQFNSDLPGNILSTKTRVGVPIARTEDVLKGEKVISTTTPLFVRIDQLERLYGSDALRPNLGIQYRRIINKALGQRDSRVSYRVGTRRYAWDDDLLMYGTNDRLEHLRDYRIVDLDDKMRRKEDSKTWLFPDFASDAFGRRLKHAGYLDATNSKDLLVKVFGTASPPEEAARQYAKNADPVSLLRLDDGWPDKWVTFLTDLVSKDPCSAVLASAWALQTGGRGKKVDRRQKDPPSDSPWSKTYWKKERVRQCLMQIAARNRQRLRWSGQESILNLSTPNISVFLSVCHEIWDAFLRSEQRVPLQDRSCPVRDGIHPDFQSVGIQTASQEWYEKIAEQPHGHGRQRFIDVLGRLFRAWLLEDRAMSNPGHNGFSLSVEELRTCPELQKFLQEASDFGDLYDTEHTTKEKNRKQRRKWYLNPILSTFFQVPEAHPKEPRYVTIAEVGEWLKKADVEISGLPTKVRSEELSSPSDSIPESNQRRLPFDSDC